MEMSESDDYDDEDTVSNDDQFAGGQLGQMMEVDEEALEEYFTWDLVLKNVYKLPTPDIFLARHEVRHFAFYQGQRWQLNTPFLILYRDPT